MPDANWKKAERAFADIFGTVRNALSGGNSKVSRSDSLHEELYLESKYSAKSSLWTLFEDTKPKAQKENKIPILGIKKKNRKGTLIVIHSDDVEVVCKILRKVRNAKRKGTYQKVEQLHKVQDR